MIGGHGVIPLVIQSVFRNVLPPSCIYHQFGDVFPLVYLDARHLTQFDVVLAVVVVDATMYSFKPSISLHHLQKQCALSLVWTHHLPGEI